MPSVSPQAPWVLAVRAQWLTLAGRFAEALPIQERVVRMERKGNALALNNLAFLERATGRRDLALPILNGLVERLPSYPDPWLNIAESERGEGNTEAAIAAYVRYLDLRPRDLRAAEALCGLYGAARRFAEAEAVWKSTLRGDLLDARIWNNVGSLRLAQGDLAGAEQAMERALAIDPAYPRARFNLAKLWLIAGRQAEGRRILEALARAAPADDVAAAAARELAGLPEGGVVAGRAAKPRENRAP